MIKDIGTLQLDGGRTHVDDADRKGMGWMTFEDAIAYSRNVVAAKVALGLGTTTSDAVGVLHDDWSGSGFGAARPASTSPARSAGSSATRRSAPWRQIDLANGAFGQGVAVTPIQLATAYSAMVNGGTLVQPHVVKAIGDARDRRRRRGQVIDPACRTTLVEPDGPRRHRGPVLPRPDARPGLRRRRQDRHRPDLGSDGPRGRGDWKHDIFNYSFVGYIGREQASPTWSSPSGSTRARRPSPGSASSRCRSCRSSCSGGSRPTRSPRPDLLPGAPPTPIADRAAADPVTTVLCDTGSA